MIAPIIITDVRFLLSSYVYHPKVIYDMLNESSQQFS